MCYGYQTWSEESLMQVYDDDDLHGGQRSSEVKCGNYVIWLPNLVRRNPVQVYDDDDLHEGQRSSEVKCGKRCTLVTKLGQKNPWCKFMMMMTFMKVRGHQRSNVVNFELWLPNLVNRIARPSRLRHFNECFRLTLLVPLQRAQSCLLKLGGFA